MIRNPILHFLIHPEAGARGHAQFGQNFIVNLFEKGDISCTQKFPAFKIKRKLLDHYLKGICNITSCYGVFTIEISSPNSFHDKYKIQKDDLSIFKLYEYRIYEYQIFKNSYRIHKNIQHKLTKSKLNIHKRCIFTYL